jgi:hypothetical protein
MYRIKLFRSEQADDLQHAINEWLSLNKDILIHGSNLAGNKVEEIKSGDYLFYLLYASPDKKAEELKEMAATVTQEQSVDVKEMNPEILKPSS